MTFHCAGTYFDDETQSVGFLIGSDSRMTTRDKSTLEIRTFQVDKSFSGRRTVGFIRGTVPKDGCEPEEKFKSEVDGLDDQFEEIDEGVNYSHISLLARSKKYVLLIGKQSNESLDLYTVSNQRKKDPHVAKRLHRITLEMYHTEETSLFLGSFNDRDYIDLDIMGRMDFNMAKTLMENCLRMNNDKAKELLRVPLDYEPGEPNMYKLSFQGIEKIG
tara:strand:- start:5157 stop:5807 length:651 start_codon:yes stop_codon:yes gene_type:complete